MCTGNETVFRDRWSRRPDKAQDRFAQTDGYCLLAVDEFLVIELLSDAYSFNWQYICNIPFPRLKESMPRVRIQYEYLPGLIHAYDMNNASPHTARTSV
jgi:hypothetical protein